MFYECFYLNVILTVTNHLEKENMMNNQSSKDKESTHNPHKDENDIMHSIMKYLYQPIDPSSLGMTRFLYGNIHALK